MALAPPRLCSCMCICIWMCVLSITWRSWRTSHRWWSHWLHGLCFRLAVEFRRRASPWPSSAWNPASPSVNWKASTDSSFSSITPIVWVKWPCMEGKKKPMSFAGPRNNAQKPVHVLVSGKAAVDPCNYNPMYNAGPRHWVPTGVDNHVSIKSDVNKNPCK